MAECMHTQKNNKELILRQQYVVHTMKKASGEAARPEFDPLTLTSCDCLHLYRSIVAQNNVFLSILIFF